MGPDKSNPILIVDDDENDFFFLERAFQQNETKNLLVHATNGEEAVEYLKGEGKFTDRNKFPLPFFVLLDLKMPRMGGFEVLSWVRDQPGLRRLPIVVFTSSKEIQDVNQAYELGANTVLVKPVKLDHLREMITTLNSYWVNLAEVPNLSAAATEKTS